MDIDRGKGEPKPALLPFLLVATPICLFEVLVFFVGVPFGLSWTVALSAHVVALGGCAMALAYHVRRNWDSRLVMINLTLGALLGPFGMVSAVMAGLLSACFVNDSAHTKALLAVLLPALKESPITEAARRLRAGLDRVDEGTTPIPFFDLMAYGSIEQKRAVIGATLRYFSPELTSVLRLGLKDETNSVRVLAATALVTLEEKYHARFVILQKEIACYPDDRELIGLYAKHCEAFAFSNLLGEERAAKMREHAIYAYLELIKDQEPSLEMSLSLAHLYLTDGQPEKALACLSSWIAEKEPATDVILFYGEALYALNRYDELRKLGVKYPKALKIGGEGHQTPNPLALWGGANA